MRYLTFLALVVVAITAGCKRSTAPEPTGSAGATTTDPAHIGSAVAATGSSGSALTPDAAPAAPQVARPAAFEEFEAVLLPLIREPEGDERSKKTCAQLLSLRKKALAVKRSMPAGVDTTAWQAASEDMYGTIEALGPICNDDPPDDSTELPSMYEHYQRLVALLPGSASK